MSEQSQCPIVISNLKKRLSDAGIDQNLNKGELEKILMLIKEREYKDTL